MLRLTSRQLHVLKSADSTPFVARVTSNASLPSAARSTEALLVSPNETLDKIPTGFRAYLLRHDPQPAEQLPASSYVLPNPLWYLADGDVVRIAPEARSVTVLYRRSAPVNFLLTTDRCNHYCLMCSQPPRDDDDGYLVDELLTAIPLFDPGTREIGLTGGEPTLLGPRLLELLRCLRNYLPDAAVHVLSNGRRFMDATFVDEVADLRLRDLMFGIPLYADVAEIHDFVVQARGAFDETLRGILNLKRAGIPVEIRFVIHRETFARLPQFAEFLARNLVLVDHVALMGLEPIGFAKANASQLWIDPVAYQAELSAAVRTLTNARMNVSIYNHQLCVLDQQLWPYARRSISDWKNEYLPECARCSVRHECGGFFAAGLSLHSDYIKPVDPAP